MNKFVKIATVGLSLLLAATSSFADEKTQQGKDPITDSLNDGQRQICQGEATRTDGVDAMQPQTKVHFYDGQNDVFVLVNEVDNTVDVVTYANGKPTRLSDTVDVVAGVHELSLIFRPKSVAIVEGKIVYIAANSDTTMLRVLELKNGKLTRLTPDTLNIFPGSCDAFAMERGKLRITGDNPLGYTIAVFDVKDGIENLRIDTNMWKTDVLNYHKPKKAEVIADADPVGIGLTVAAVSVVFLVLMCLAIIFTQYGRLLTYFQKRRAAKAAAAQGANVDAAMENIDHSGEIDAVIAAAIYLYNEELHDEENTVITFKSVERPWTPWNAKFYNMNQNNFNNIRHTRR
jgi:Na+-transporting methylmalonyl-CoA/oxaloacetate decarboxylase gamma subunit